MTVWWPGAKVWLDVRFHDPDGLLSYPRWLSVRAECVRRIGERLARDQIDGTCKAWCYKGTGRFTEYRFDWLVEPDGTAGDWLLNATHFIRVCVWEVYYHRLLPPRTIGRVCCIGEPLVDSLKEGGGDGEPAGAKRRQDGVRRSGIKNGRSRQ